MTAGIALLTGFRFDPGLPQLDNMNSVVNIAAYKFVTLDELEPRRAALRERCRALGLKGTILLSVEGINLFVAGARDSINALLDDLRGQTEFANLEVKESLSDRQPFNRMLVRIKKEIIAFGIGDIDPRVETSRRLSAKELKAWLDEGRPVTLLDTRNDYEFEIGTFENAVPIGLDEFRRFPEAVNNLPGEMKDQPVVTFCTGGIRCEKAAPFLEKAGFENVYQLDGGILKYFEECGGEHYRGDCFVFDQRVALDPSLKETETVQCYVCQTVLTKEDSASDNYVPGKSCPHCFESRADAMARVIEKRHAAIQKLAHPLPGSQPYENRRPIKVTAKFHGYRLIDFLEELKTIQAREGWLKICAEDRLLFNDKPLNSEAILNAGQVLILVVPMTVEPDVNAAIEILHEDDAIVVVNKPAPLPMHPSGRFNRNTLRYFLDAVYRPMKVRPAHRLDANTSGVVVCYRTRAVARKLQPQFELGEAKKGYLARIQGNPESNTFDCEAPISRTPIEVGARIVDAGGFPSRTEFEVIERFNDGTTLLNVRPLSGRTNQIRVHLWHLGMPVCGDPLYLPDGQLGGKQTLKPEDPPLCLHAATLEIKHPKTDERARFDAPSPAWAQASQGLERSPKKAETTSRLGGSRSRA